MTYPGATLPQLLAWLRELPPIERARLAGVLTDARTVVAAAAVRREAIYEATRTAPRAEVSAELGVSHQAIGKAITEHRRATLQATTTAPPTEASPAGPEGAEPSPTEPVPSEPAPVELDQRQPSGASRRSRATPGIASDRPARTPPATVTEPPTVSPVGHPVRQQVEAGDEQSPALIATGRVVDLSAAWEDPVGTWQLIAAGEGSWHLHHAGSRVGVVRRESTSRGRRGWSARADTGGPQPATGGMAVTGSSLWRTRDLAAAAIARNVIRRTPRRRRK